MRTISSRARPKPAARLPMTAEARLWAALRQRHGGAFIRQAHIAGHMVDFLCQDAGLIVEVDVAPLRTAALRAASAARTQTLQSKGFRIVRLWADHIDSHLDGALAIIEAELGREARARGARPLKALVAA